MITYYPNVLLKQIAPKAKIRRMVKSNLTLKKTALNFVDAIDFIDRSKVDDVALKVMRSYQQREAKAQADAGFEKSAGKEVRDEIVDDPKLLIARVQNEVVYQVTQEIRGTYEGDEYEWLPSDAEEPDPEHQLNYGKVFTIGEGEMPGERPGCRCGMRILTKQTKLDLG